MIFIKQPHNPHFQHVLNKWTTELTEICISRVIGDPEYTNERISLNLKGIKNYVCNYNTFKSTKEKGKMRYRETHKPTANLYDYHEQVIMHTTKRHIYVSSSRNIQ